MSLNRFYLDNVAPPASQDMVRVHAPINGGRIDTLCNVTAASMAWLLTSKDCAPPFSDAWQDAAEGTGPEGVDRLIAYGTNDDEWFEDIHVLLMLHRDGKKLVVDSNWAERRTLSVLEVTEAPPTGHGEHARYILF